MLRQQYSSNPYDTTRPKSFFSDRKRLMNSEITQGNGGKTFNASWNANRKPTVKPLEKDAGHSKLDSLSSLTLYISILIASLVWVS